jgi:NADH:ubiquinone oxidoreductase subunit 6 (subunit J)
MDSSSGNTVQMILGQYQPYIYFYALSIVIVFSALQVATRRNLVHAALFLCLMFLGVAGIFIMLNAEFLAVVQILIYAGAITILILFAIMLTQNLTGKELKMYNRQVLWTGLTAIGFTCMMLYMFLHTVTLENGEVYNVGLKWAVQGNLQDMAVEIPNTILIGQSLMSTYTLAFWIASMILTIAMIGGLIMARKD